MEEVLSVSNPFADDQLYLVKLGRRKLTTNRNSRIQAEKKSAKRRWIKLPAIARTISSSPGCEAVLTDTLFLQGTDSEERRKIEKYFWKNGD